MSVSILKNTIHLKRYSQLCPASSRLYSLYEPNYLQALKPKIPLYSSLNVQIRGYDYPILEKFQGFIHKLANHMGMEVQSSWVMPAKELKIKRYKPRSEVIESEYTLNLYERNVEILKASSTSLPILVRILEASVPMGIFLEVENYDSTKELRRYVPDTELLDLKDELEAVEKQ